MFKVNFSQVDGFTPDQAAKLEKARVLWEQVWNSDKFKQAVLNFSYTYTTGSLWWKKSYSEKGFRWNNDLSTQQIYDKLMSGAELLAPTSDNEADIQITLYVASGSTIGYTYPNTAMQWINAKFFNSFTAADVVGNLSHEYCHKLGFDHEYKATALRPYTVPYAIGYMSGDMATEIMKAA